MKLVEFPGTSSTVWNDVLMKSSLYVCYFQSNQSTAFP